MGSKKLKKIRNNQEDLQQLVTRNRKKKEGQNIIEITAKDMNQTTETKQKRKKQKAKQVETESIDTQEYEPTEEIINNSQSKGTEKKTRKKLKQLQNTVEQKTTINPEPNNFESIVEHDIEDTLANNQSKLLSKKSRKRTSIEPPAEDIPDNQIKLTERKSRKKQKLENSIEQSEPSIESNTTIEPLHEVIPDSHVKVPEKRYRKKQKLQNLIEPNLEPTDKSEDKSNTTIEPPEEVTPDNHVKITEKKVRKKQKLQNNLEQSEPNLEPTVAVNANLQPPEEVIPNNQVKLPEKKSKKKQKVQNSQEQSEPILEQTVESNNTDPPGDVSDSSSKLTDKKLKKKQKHLQNVIEQSYSTDSDTILENNENNIEVQPKKEKTEIVWPAEDLAELIKNMESCIPEGDHLSFKSRLGKLDWEKVTFKEHSVTECQTVWTQLEKKVRGYRLLLEVLEDAKKVIDSPPKVQERPPKMPKPPPSAAVLFSLKKKAKISSENPNLEPSELSKLVMQTYKSLPLDKREKYEKQALTLKEEYKQNLELFFLNHPEVERTAKQKKAIEKDKISNKPKKPDTPFRLYYLSELKEQNIPDAEKHEFKEKCKELWRQMPDNNKLFWIKNAEEKFKINENYLKEYMRENPDYVPSKVFNHCLTRDDIIIKKRLAGQPKKPPISVYSLYTSLRLQNEELKQLVTKERLALVSAEWKNMAEDQKQKYKDMWINLTNEYKKKYETYLSTLSQDERRLEIESNVSKKKRKADEPAATDKPDNKKAKTSENSEPTEELPAPEQPEPSATAITTNPAKPKRIEKKVKVMRPKKPPTPFGLFCISERQNTKVPENEKQEFKLACKTKWLQMPDKKKLVFITEAQDKYKEYEKTYKKFMSENPDLARTKFTRPMLSKQDLYIIERMSGKPRKPPGSVYSYFASVNLLTEELKQTPVRERLTRISTMWKELSDEEKGRYKELWTNKMEQFKKDFKAYLANLPEDKRQQEIKNSQIIKTRKELRTKASNVKKPTIKRKPEKLTEPEQPPISVFSYFVKCYKGDRPVSEAWKSLSAEEKKRYQQELVEKKQEYIKEFERFLRSLTKEQLEQFSKERMKNACKKSEGSDEDNEEEDDEDDDEDENSEEDESEEESEDEDEEDE